MPSHTCNICKKYEYYSSRVAFLHKCQVCFRPFCKECAASYFLCKACAAELPAGVPDRVVDAMKQPRKTMESTMVGSGIGAILLPTTIITVLILVFTGARYLIFLPILQAISGIVLLIVNAAMRYLSRMAMQQAASAVLRDFKRGVSYPGTTYNQVGGWQQQPQAYLSDVQPIVPPATSPAIPRSAFMTPAASPAIPSSAFMPEVNEVPYQAPGTNKKGRNVPASFDVTSAISTPKDSKFCGSCGAALPDIHDLRFCPGCGASIE